MRVVVKMCLFLCLAVIAGCGPKPHDAQTAVFQIEGGYGIALKAAVDYKELPRCTKPKTALLCSEASVVKALQDADDKAYPAIQAAEDAVRDPNFQGGTSSAVIVAAQAALNALTAIVATLPKK